MEESTTDWNKGYRTAYDQVEREHWNSTYDRLYEQNNKIPVHYYAVGGIEVIDYIKAKLTPEQYKGYLLGNIYKYSGRLEYKGEPQADAKKLAKYTGWLQEIYDNNF